MTSTPDCLAAYKQHYAGPQYSGLRVCAGLSAGQMIDRRTYFDDAAFFQTLDTGPSSWTKG